MFYKCINNGVIAIVSQEVYDLLEEYWRLPDNIRAITLYPAPIFTFVDPKYEYHETYWGYVTGSTELMDDLLRGSFAPERTFYVPFSNCSHLNGDTAELRYRTTLKQAIETFGLTKARTLAVAA